MAIVVPASGEPPKNIIKLLESVLTQQGVSPEQFEVIVVVNNRLDDRHCRLQRTFY